MGTTLKSLLFLLGLATAAPAVAATDPTAPPISLAAGGNSAPASAPATLAWVRVNGKQSLAWYGSTTVRLGDAVEGGRVVAIREDGIVIAGSGGRRTLTLIDPAVRTRPSKNTR
jgi:hypothetical protein